MIDIVTELRRLVGFYTGIKPHDVLRANLDQPSPTRAEDGEIINFATVLMLSNDMIGATPYYRDIHEERYTFKAKFAIAFYGDYALENANKFMMGWRGDKGEYQQTQIEKSGIEMATQVNSVLNQQNDLPRYNLNCSFYYQGIMNLDLETIGEMSVETTRVETDQHFLQTIKGD